MSTKHEFSAMKDIRMKFGAKVKDLRVSKGYSQEKLAELSVLDRTYIPGIESGKRNVSLVVIEKIAKGFKIRLIEL